MSHHHRRSTDMAFIMDAYGQQPSTSVSFMAEDDTWGSDRDTSSHTLLPPTSSQATDSYIFNATNKFSCHQKQSELKHILSYLKKVTAELIKSTLCCEFRFMKGWLIYTNDVSLKNISKQISYMIPLALHHVQNR